jgi:hypothetical protein
MDAATLRKLVWEEMLYADMRANYFGELVRRYLLLDKALRAATLVGTSGSVAAALLSSGPAKIAVPILATAVSFWLLISQYGTMARDASDLHYGWGSLARDYTDLWNSLDRPDAEACYHEIFNRGESLSKSGAKFPNKANRLSFWLDHAAAMARARYA